ncbi:MAG: DUF6686 family protein [Bacteroidota bacterium]
MYPKVEVLGYSKSGEFSFCNHSKLFQLRFNNLCFEFYEWELANFKRYLASLLKDFKQNCIQDTNGRTKIPLSVGNKYFIILLTHKELVEMCGLLNYKHSTPRLINAKDIDYISTKN